MLKNKKNIAMILVFVVVIVLAFISFQIRQDTGFESTPVAEEIAPSIVFTIGPLQVTSTVVNTWIMILAIGVGSYFLGKSFKVRPGMLQNAIEWLANAIEDMIIQNTGTEKTGLFLPIVGTLAVFIGVANLLGLIPGLQSPTPDINTPLSMALIVFLSVPYFGIRSQGLWGYLKHYVEPIFFMLPIEVASEIARTFSLTFRLFGNILGEEIIIAILFVISPFILPVPMMLFSIFTGILQAYIFSLLTCVYIGGAVRAHQQS
jgi:F-type H+-transporting ATPase subunit a